jgi:hypothetical protein
MTREFKILLLEPEGRIPRGRLRSNWEDNIKMGKKEIRWVYLSKERSS